MTSKRTTTCLGPNPDFESHDELRMECTFVLNGLGGGVNGKTVVVLIVLGRKLTGE